MSDDSTTRPDLPPVKVASPPAPPPPADPLLAGFLARHGLLEAYEPLYRGAVTVDVMDTLTEQDLVELGVSSIGIRRRLLKILQAEKATTTTTPDATISTLSEMYEVLGLEGAVRGTYTKEQLQKALSESRVSFDDPARVSGVKNAPILRVRDLLGAISMRPEMYEVLGLEGAVRGTYTKDQLQKALSERRVSFDDPVRVSGVGNAPIIRVRELSGASIRKSRVASILLSFFLGEFGADRFHAGHMGIGAMKLATTLLFIFIFLSGAARVSRRWDDDHTTTVSWVLFLVMAIGIWWFVDFILFATGAIRKDGEGRPIRWE